MATRRNHRQQVRLDSAPNERSDLQIRQVSDALDRDARTPMQVNVIRLVVTNGVEQRDQLPVSLIVHGVGKKYRVDNHEAGLFCYFPV